MKLKSLILGSVAAAGLSTAGYAADLGVLTSLDVCDALGLSGLTISSDTNCLQISGEVKYEFNWGDYRGSYTVANTHDSENTLSKPFTIDDNDGAAGTEHDWESQVDAWLKFVGTADSDFGAAKAVIKLKAVNETRVQNEVEIASDDDTGASPVGGINQDKGLWKIDEAYVSVGDSTVIMAGKKGSIANFGDDEPFNFLALFGSEAVDKGVAYDIDLAGGNALTDFDTGGAVIQVTSDLGNGVSASLGLENLDDGKTQWAGTLVGVLAYAGEGVTAHITGLAGGILDGTVDAYAMHAGVTATFDMFKVRAALAANNDTATNNSTWNGLVSAQGTFDMFTIAISGEAAGATGMNTNYGIGGSIGATVTDGVSINIGGRYYDNQNGGSDGYQVAAQLVAAVTEAIKLTGEIGVYGNSTANTSDFYGAAELAWAPGGGFTSSIKGEAHQNGAYKVTFKAAKAFQ